jgi:hypothetical protein
MAQRHYKTLLQGLLTGFLAEKDPAKTMPELVLTDLSDY